MWKSAIYISLFIECLPVSLNDCEEHVVDVDLDLRHGLVVAHDGDFVEGLELEDLFLNDLLLSHLVQRQQQPHSEVDADLVECGGLDNCRIKHFFILLDVKIAKVVQGALIQYINM